MPTTRKRKPVKRGSKQPIDTVLQAAAVAREMKAKAAATKRAAADVRKLQKEFEAEHKRGLAALEKRDYEALSEAIDQEAAILRKQGDLLPKPKIKSVVGSQLMLAEPRKLTKKVTLEGPQPMATKPQNSIKKR